MRKISLIAISGMLSLSIGGCSFLPWSGNSDEEIAETVVQNPAITPPANNASSQGEDFNQPLEPGQSKPVVVSSLIQPTNSQERVKQVEKGRKDPFAVVPMQPLVAIAPPDSVPPPPPANSSLTARTNTRQTFPSTPTPNSNKSTARTNTKQALPTPPTPNSNKSTARTITKPGSPATPSSNSPQRNDKKPSTQTPLVAGSPESASTTEAPVAAAPNSSIPELPPIPQPDLAMGIEVTGVVEVGGTAQAIVKAPNEPFSRYVKPGQYLSNGQVLVKRIVMTQDSLPIVVFEQFGVEVSRTVGEEIPDLPSQGAESPTAFVPVFSHTKRAAFFLIYKY